MDPAQLTADIYYDHQPAAVRALRGLPDDQRATLASQLVAQGYVIDLDIMVYGWDPLKIMAMRERFGLAWVPNLGQDIQFAFTFPNPAGLPLYDAANPPKGAILTSTNAADYPPIDPPKPTVPVSTANPVRAWTGLLIGGKRQYFCNPEDSSPAGTETQGPEGKLVKEARDTPWGRYQRWNPAV